MRPSLDCSVIHFLGRIRSAETDDRAETSAASDFRKNAGSSNTTTIHVHDLKQDPWLRLGQHLELLLLLDHRRLHRFQPMLDRHQIPTWFYRRPICTYGLRFGGYRIISALSHRPRMGKDGETTQCSPRTALFRRSQYPHLPERQR